MLGRQEEVTRPPFLSSHDACWGQDSSVCILKTLEMPHVCTHVGFCQVPTWAHQSLFMWQVCLSDTCPRLTYSFCALCWNWVAASLWQGSGQRAGCSGSCCCASCHLWRWLQWNSFQAWAWCPLNRWCSPLAASPYFSPLRSPSSLPSPFCFPSQISSLPLHIFLLPDHIWGQFGGIVWTSECFLWALLSLCLGLFPLTPAHLSSLTSLSVSSSCLSTKHQHCQQFFSLKNSSCVSSFSSVVSDLHNG